jgi:hypothetical protein
MQREDGVLAEIFPGGTEMRLHRFRRPGGDVMRRIPWHQDKVAGEWYSGIEGPEIKIEVLREFLK